MNDDSTASKQEASSDLKEQAAGAGVGAGGGTLFVIIAKFFTEDPTLISNIALVAPTVSAAIGFSWKFCKIGLIQGQVHSKKNTII